MPFNEGNAVAFENNFKYKIFGMIQSEKYGFILVKSC